jgi:hypothetical protein
MKNATDIITSAGHLLGALRITAFRPVDDDRTDGFFDVLLPGLGLEVNNFRRRELNGVVTITVPTRPRQVGDKWVEYPLLRFISTKARREFEAAVDLAFIEYFGGQPARPANLDALVAAE